MFSQTTVYTAKNGRLLYEPLELAVEPGASCFDSNKRKAPPMGGAHLTVFHGIQKYVEMKPITLFVSR